MLSEKDFEQLLSQGESRYLDFKSESYNLDGIEARSKFIKDIIAMANTPRVQPAYIITGVKCSRDGSKELLGISEHPDDNDLQNMLKLAKAGIETRPSFTYQPFTYKGKSYGVFEIHVNKTGPFYASRDFGVLEAYKIYWRRSSQNDIATDVEKQVIVRWFSSEDTQKSDQQGIDNLEFSNWPSFEQACHHFDRNRLYLLVIAQNDNVPLEVWESLARLPLSLVLDFDPATDENGVFSAIKPSMEIARSVHLWTLGDDSILVPEKTCYWYAARGLKGRSSSLSEGDWKQWNRKYGRALSNLLEDFARASSGRPITVISLWYAPEYLREICASVDRFFEDRADYVFAVPEAERLADISETFSGTTISIQIQDILHGIHRHLASVADKMLQFVSIPNSSGSFSPLGHARLNWLSEDLEVLHSNAELEGDIEIQHGYNYLRGAPLAHRDLSEHWDADREITSHIKRAVESDLQSRTASRINLYHWPGAGGTTVARRVAWDLRHLYPVVLLNRITAGETVGRFREIFQISGQPTLAVVEGRESTSDLEKLYTEVKAENIPVVFLSVLRRFDTPSTSRRTFFLGQVLDLAETYRFIEAFKRISPGKARNLQRFLGNGIDTRERTPFNLALEVFEADFLGVERYVEARLEASSPIQREIIAYIAMAYYYGHKSILPQILAAHLGKPENKQLFLEDILGEPQLELLVREFDGKWRPTHQLVAEQIIAITLSGNSSERRNWKSNLSIWALQFIEVCHQGGGNLPSDDLIDLLRRVFILRDERELLGTESSGTSKFSKLIEDIPVEEGRLSILRALVESFPDEPHFWGHLGRFYSNQMKEMEKAVNALDNAIRLAPNDPVLHHMKAMCYRQKVYDLINDVARFRLHGEHQDTIKELTNMALVTFAQARDLEPDTEHAFISPIQLVIRVLDFGFTQSKCSTKSEFLGSRSATWYREKLDEAENLLDKVRVAREGEGPSKYVIECEAHLDQMYDDYSRALQDWNNLLDRQDVYSPPIRRQIVRTYLAGHEQKWDKLDTREIERIVDLMEQNLREEPASEHNLRLWFQALRHSYRHDIDLALDRLVQWKTIGDAQDAHYYTYVLHVLKAIEGSTIERVRAKDLIEQSANRARGRKNRTQSFEWLGEGQGLSRLIHYSELGDWDDSLGFYSDTKYLTRLQGRISDIKGPEAGNIELLSCGLSAFFVPIKAGAIKGRDENHLVEFFLGFSYDGLRAWSVKLI